VGRASRRDRGPRIYGLFVPGHIHIRSNEFQTEHGGGL
jgi:hypothetical protein